MFPYKSWTALQKKALPSSKLQYTIFSEKQTIRVKTSSDVRMVLAIVVAWYANISLSPGALMMPGSSEALPGGTIQSIGSASSLPYLRVPYTRCSIYGIRVTLYPGCLLYKEAETCI